MTQPIYKGADLLQSPKECPNQIGSAAHNQHPNAYYLGHSNISRSGLMKEKGQIRKDWAELLKKRDCKDMSKYFTNIIFNEIGL